LILYSNPAYAYRGNKQPRRSSVKITKNKERQTTPFSIMSFLKEKLFSAPSTRLRPSRSERTLAYKKGKAQYPETLLLAEKQNMTVETKV